ncbi:hypothetical protein LUX33_22450 [Actinomadura madurae]|uniref:hypothetical protein n=1 Tax=Actinomadura madurae TaxID=1993 RepID=UPI0020D1FD40|nr:hypothetical protein [Actinomadura madurae]MCP9950904.1 hypothetical protein [Actinomadura madurae]
MRRGTRRLAATATALLLSLGMAGCGGSPPKQNIDEVIIAFPSDVDTIDPHQFRSVAAFGVVGNIYGTLLQEDYTAPAGRDPQAHRPQHPLPRQVGHVER